MQHLTTSIIIGVLMTGACVTDLRDRRIPNTWTMSFSIVGLTMAAVDQRFVTSLMGGVTGLLIGFLLYVFARVVFGPGAFGAGDGKLSMALGFFTSPKVVLLTWAAAFLLSGVFLTLRTAREKGASGVLALLRVNTLPPANGNLGTHLPFALALTGGYSFAVGSLALGLI